MQARGTLPGAARCARARRNEAKSGETNTKQDETDAKRDETGDCVLAPRKPLIAKGGEIGECVATSVFNDLTRLHFARHQIDAFAGRAAAP